MEFGKLIALTELNKDGNTQKTLKVDFTPWLKQFIRLEGENG
jgi:hypothetical protein